MRCPFCGHEDTQVKDSRPAEDGSAIRRRRFCAHCGQRFTTIERTQLRELTVIKSDGRRVPFDRDKLSRSIRTATRKRPIQEERIERIVNGIVTVGSERRERHPQQADRRAGHGHAEGTRLGGLCPVRQRVSEFS